MAQNQIAQDKALSNLSARWTFPENDGIVTGKLGFGDVSSWATATSKPFGTQFSPRRPNENRAFSSDCAGFKPAKSNPVPSLMALQKFHEPKPLKPHDPSVIVMPIMAKDESVAKAIKSLQASSDAIDERITLQNKLDSTYASKVRKRAKVEKAPQVAKELKMGRFEPGIVGLDRVKKEKPAKRAQWELDKEQESLWAEYGLLLRSLIRLIHG